MKFFEHFFKTDEIKKQELTEIFHKIDKSNWIQVFSACLGKVMVIQNNASDMIVKGRGCTLDFENRALFFGESEYKIQYIGSESSSDVNSGSTERVFRYKRIMVSAPNGA